MTRDDVPALSAQLNALADVYDKRNLTPQAVQVWVDTVKEFPAFRVISLLIEWPKVNAKMPTPGDVWKKLNDRAIDDREAQQQTERAMYENGAQAFVNNLQGRAITSRLLQGINTAKKDGKAWARRILVAYADKPESVNWLQLEYAREAMGLDVRTGMAKGYEREPGQDDEELAA